MLDVMVDVEHELLDPEFMELEVHLRWVGVLMGDSLVPAVPQSRRPVDVEVLIGGTSEVVSLCQHVITHDVEVGELGQAEVTVHDAGDVAVGSS